MKKLIFTVAAASLVLAGCETTSSRPYKASTENIIALQKSLANSGNKVQVGAFSVASGVDTELTCRAMGAIDVSPGKDAVAFIQDAFREELFEAGAYDAENGRVIKGQITEFNADSWGKGKWEVGLMLSSDSLPNGLNVNTVYEFKSSFSAIKACQNVVDAFTPTVQQLIKQAVEHSDFAKLAK